MPKEEIKFDDPYLSGVKAYDQYLPRSSNPWPIGTMLSGIWDVGYSDRKNGYVDEFGYSVSSDERM